MTPLVGCCSADQMAGAEVTPQLAGAAQEEQEHEGPEGLLGLQDDLFGAIFAHLGDDPQAQQAVRLTCKKLKESQAIMQRINSLNILQQEEELEKIADFARVGRLRTLHLLSGPTLPACPAWPFLKAALTSREICGVLNSVEKLTMTVGALRRAAWGRAGGALPAIGACTACRSLKPQVSSKLPLPQPMHVRVG